MRSQRRPRRPSAVKRPTHRIYTPVTDAELALIDTYWFGQSLSEQPEAIRRAVLGFETARRDAR
jgi:hypothetical protein